MKYFTGIALLFFSLQTFAQADTTATGIVVHKDPRIEMLIKKQIEINEITTRESRRFVPGYRIQVMNTNDRNKAIEAKTKIYEEFPELKAYLMWKAPFYRLKVGNFKERKDAEEYLSHIQRIFTSGVYVVRDTIEVNPDKSGDL